MKISEEFDAIIGFAREEAMRTGDFSIHADHLFLGLLRHRDNEAVRKLLEAGIEPAACKSYVESFLFRKEAVPYSMAEEIRLHRSAENAVNMAIAEAMREGAEEAGSIHLLRAICKQENCYSGMYLRRTKLPGMLEKAPKKKTSPATNAPEVSAEQMSRLFATIKINNTIPS